MATVRAARTFQAHRDQQHRTFVKGEEIPADWIPAVKLRRHLDGDVPHLPTLEEELAELEPAPVTAGTTPDEAIANSYATHAADANVDDLVTWVLDDNQPGDKVARAPYARRLEGEKGDAARKTAIQQLAEIMATEPPTIEVSTGDAEADDAAVI